MSGARRTEARAGLAVGSLCVLLFCLAFGVSSSALRPFLVGQANNLTETKINWFREHGPEYDTLFFGSSRAYRGFVPEVFERATAAAGVETRAFNFGSPASRVFDAHRALGRLESGGSLRNVKWVLVDPEPLPWLLRAKDKESMLARGPIDWHDPATTWLVLRYIWAFEGATLAEKVSASAEHLHSCCYFVAGIGGTENLVRALLGKSLIDRSDLTDRLGRRLDGWLPPDYAVVSREENKSHFLQPKRQAAYRAELARRRKDIVDDGPPSPHATVFYTRLARKIESLGATPIFVTQPSLNLQQDLIKARRDGLVEHLLRYDDPDEERLAALYEPENRWDRFHLAEPGANIFTELLARDFVELVRGFERQP